MGAPGARSPLDLLAAANIYLSLAASEGLRAARRWAGMILLVALGVCVLSLVTRWPLGPISFPRRLGMQIFGVPFGVPLLWFILVAGGREVVARVLPRASHLQVALLTGCSPRPAPASWSPSPGKIGRGGSGARD